MDNGGVFYVVEFASRTCEIEVFARALTTGGAVFIAEAHVSERDGDHLRPIVNQDKRIVHVPEASEDGALNRMVAFLERHFGAIKTPPRLSDREEPQNVMETYTIITSLEK